MCRLCALLGDLAQVELPPSNTTFQIPSQHIESSIDWAAHDYLPASLADQTPDKLIPLQTTGDGNCLLHAVSRAIFGVEVYNDLLRTKMHEELTNNATWYKTIAKGFEEKDWTRVVLNASRPNAYLEFMHTLALAHVIKRPIILYASDADMDRYGMGESGVAATFVPSRFKPSACSTSPPIVLAWQSEHKNHYVALVGVESATPPFTNWPILPPAFPDGLTAGTTVDMYIHKDGPILLPTLNERLAEEKQVQQLQMQEKIRQVGAEARRRRVEQLVNSLLTGAGVEDMDMEENSPRFGGKPRGLQLDDGPKTLQKGKERENPTIQSEIAETLRTLQEVWNVSPGSDSQMWNMRGASVEDALYEEKFMQYYAQLRQAAEKKRQAELKAERKRLEAERLAKLERELWLAQRTQLKNGKATYRGKEWDFVLEAKVGGQKLCWIAFNKDENPDVVADRFMLEQGVSKEYKSAIRGFIANKQEAAQKEKEYKEQLRAAMRASCPKTARVPVTDPPIMYAQGRYDGILKKLGEFNQLLATSQKSHLALSPTEGAQFNILIDTLKAVSSYNSTSFLPEHFDILNKLMSWPPEQLFPALDVMRLFILHPSASKQLAHNNRLLTFMLTHVGDTTEAVPANKLIALKFIANMFSNELLRKHASDNYDAILIAMSRSVGHTDKNVRLLLANVVLNYAVHVASAEVGVTELKTLLATLSAGMLRKELELTAPSSSSGNDVIFSLLCAVGQLGYADKDVCAKLEACGVVATLMQLVQHPEARVAQVAREVLAILVWGPSFQFPTQQ